MAFYIAYGSNMYIAQMDHRCPGAKLVGKAILNDWQLMFKSAFATIERGDGYTVPVLIWEINNIHEKSLDRYEGFPSFYYKKNIQFSNFEPLNDFNDDIKTGMVYIMHENNPFNLPSVYYYSVLEYAYRKFNLDIDILKDAVSFTQNKMKEMNKNIEFE